MPYSPLNKKCSMLGCNNEKLHKSSYCELHSTKQKYVASKQRQDNNSMYQTQQWVKFRQIQLSKNPLCAGCLSSGVVTQAEHVDHVFAWTHIGKQAFYFNLFQSLCQSCHSSKTYLEKKRIYRRYGNPTIDYTKQDYMLVMNEMNESAAEFLET